MHLRTIFFSLSLLQNNLLRLSFGKRIKLINRIHRTAKLTFKSYYFIENQMFPSRMSFII